MILSFSTRAGDDAWSVAECARWARQHDFDAVRLTAAGAAEPERVLAAGPSEVHDALAAEGIALAALTAHQNLLDDDAERRELAASRLAKAIESAALLGAPVIVTHAGSFAPGLSGTRFYGQWSSPPGNPTDRSLELVERFREMYRPIVALAATKGVRIALDVAVRMGNIACCPEMWERLLAAVPSPALGLSCDPSHWLWMGILPAEDAIRAFNGKWYYADVKDCEISPRMRFRQGILGNDWWQYRVPGRGQLNWGTIIGALAEAGYDGPLCVENEDRALPGLPGLAYGGRHLRQYLPPVAGR
jgi:sugar phosphate isomerase/epimerase